MAALFAALLAAVTSIDGPAAIADRNTIPQENWPFVYYATVEPIHPEGRDSAKLAFKLAMASASPSEVLEHCVPVDVTSTLMRFDLRTAEILPADWARIVARDPYRTVDHPMISRADWLTLQISDSKAVPDAYYPIVFRGKIPPTRDDALLALRVDKTPGLSIAMIEGASGVAVNPAHVRWLENFPISRGSAFGTKDSRTVEAHKDPLERLDGTFQHDGEEWIIHRRKISLKTNRQGALACYFLADGTGKIVNVAPIDLVRDHTEFRGLAEIRVPGSCIACHQRGYNLPTKNAFLDELAAGVERLPRYDNQLELQKKLFGSFDTIFARANEDYAIAVEDGLGVKPVTAAASFQLCISRYDEPVTLETAARELYTTADQLRQAISLESNRPGTKMTTRVVGLAHGLTIPREAFEEGWYGLWFILNKWEPKNGPPAPPAGAR